MAKTRRRPTVIVFAKAPRLGAVKTRLAKGIGMTAAWRFQRDTTKALLSRLRSPRWRIMLSVSPDTFAIRGRFWDTRIPRKPQGAGDIGRRMAQAISSEGAGPVILIGSDIPAIERRHIDDAFRALGPADVVFGPAQDGGFWLVGFKQPKRARRAFRAVRWSSRHTLADTLAGFPGARIARVATLSDVDDEDAYEKWLRRS